jgi:hypothetical protein
MSTQFGVTRRKTLLGATTLAAASALRSESPVGLASTALHWRAAGLTSPGKGRSPNNLPIVVASTL